LLAELDQVDARSERAANEARNFLGAARLLALGRFALRPVVRGSREHAVFSRDPTLAFALKPGGDFLVYAGIANDFGVAHGDEHGAFRVLDVLGLEGERAESVGFAIVGTFFHKFVSLIQCVLKCQGDRIGKIR